MTGIAGKTGLVGAALLGVALLAGCSMAPKYERPDAPVEAEFPQGEAYRKDVPGAPRVEDLTWRQFFGDRKLTKVISLALENNRDLRMAVLNVEQAQAVYGIQRSEMLPVVGANAGGSRQRVPATQEEVKALIRKLFESDMPTLTPSGKSTLHIFGAEELRHYFE